MSTITATAETLVTITLGDKKETITLEEAHQLFAVLKCVILPAVPTLTLESLKSVVGEKCFRVKTVAAHFDVPPKSVEVLCTPENGFTTDTYRGWVKFSNKQ